MEIRDNEKVCIFAPLSSKLDKRQSIRLFSEIDAERKVPAIDLSYVSDCTIDFIEELKKFALKREISVFNIPSGIFVLLNIMNMDKFAKLFVSETDFEEDSRQLVNRRFVAL